jgi:hypothetical protein
MSTLLAGDRKKAAIGAAAAGGALAAAKLGGDRLSSSDDRRRFRLGDGEPVTEGIARIADGQLEMAIERLEGNTDEDLGTAVHEARKSFKRLRTTVRLARDELGDEVYRRENAAFRDAGRRLAGARDSQVLLETLATISERHPDETPAAGFLRFRRTLAGQHAAAQRRLRDGAPRAEVVGELREARGARLGLAARAGATRHPGSGPSADLPARPARLPHCPPGAEQREPARTPQTGEGPLVRGPDPEAGVAEADEARFPRRTSAV